MKKEYSERYIWVGGKIVDVKDAKINVLSPTAQFGLNVFEGIRCYWSEEKQQLYAFRLKDHLKRLKVSQRLLMIEDLYTVEELEAIFKETIIANNYKEDISVRQTIFVDGFGTWSSSGPVNMFVSPIPKSKTNPEYNKKGLHCCVSSWKRIHDSSLSPRIKCGANYINSRMAQCEALRDGYDTSILLNQDGKVAEGPGSCIFIVRNGVLITPQITDSVLESITRDTILKIASEDLKIKVLERSIDRTELYMCEEAFLCGSAMEITPIFSVDKFLIGRGEIGCTTEKLRRLYLELVVGKNRNRLEWITPIYGG